MKSLKLFFVAYPPTVDTVFESVVARLIPSASCRVFRAQVAKDIVSRAYSESMYSDIERIDVLAHGAPGLCKLGGEEYLFDARDRTFELGGLAEHLAPKADVRFLACSAGAKAQSAGWVHQPKETARWLSKELGGRTIWLAKTDIFATDFGPDGFLTAAESKLSSS